MSCKKCKSSPCACADHGLETPCTYDVCPPPAEPCEDVQCAECVSYCGPYFQVVDPTVPLPGVNVLFSINTGDRLEEILQKIALYITNPACAEPLQFHAVYHVVLNNITNDSVYITWSGVGPGTTGFNVFSSEVTGVWVQENIGPLLGPGATSFQVIGLDPNTTYLFKVEATDGVDSCDSVQIQATTLL